MKSLQSDFPTYSSSFLFIKLNIFETVTLTRLTKYKTGVTNETRLK